VDLIKQLTASQYNIIAKNKNGQHAKQHFLCNWII